MLRASCDGELAVRVPLDWAVIVWKVTAAVGAVDAFPLFSPVKAISSVFVETAYVPVTAELPSA